MGADHRFKKGHATWNKGVKGVIFEGCKATQFKRGGTPHNTKAVGDYRISGDGTLQLKIGNDHGSNSKRWRGVHELVWIAANGPIPPKHICVFKPGTKTAELEQITLDKVECISRAEHMKRNSLHNYPKEITQLIQLRGALQRQINKRKTKNEHNDNITK